MATAFKAKSEVKHGMYTLVMSGSLNEKANFSDVPVGNVKQIFVNFDGIKYVNSTGTKKWILWMNEITTRKNKIEIYFSNCTKPIVDQMNLVKGFMPASTIVKSFYVPFYCNMCQEVQNYLYRMGHEYEKVANKCKLRHPSVSCPNCKQPMEIDAPIENYFAFLNLN